MELSDEEKRWRAEQDAHTLAEAQVIKNDNSRLSAAKAEAARVAENAEERAEAYRTVSKGGSTTQRPPQRQVTRQNQTSVPKTVSVQTTAGKGDLMPGIPRPVAKSPLF